MKKEKIELPLRACEMIEIIRKMGGEGEPSEIIEAYGGHNSNGYKMLADLTEQGLIERIPLRYRVVTDAELVPFRFGRAITNPTSPKRDAPTKSPEEVKALRRRGGKAEEAKEVAGESEEEPRSTVEAQTAEFDDSWD